MPTIDEIIKQEFNPFDSSTLKTGNFWSDQVESFSVVNSIHKEAIDTLGKYLSQIKRDRKIRTIVLKGDPGSGKSYLLRRIKNELKLEGFFVYVDPWISQNSIWKHTLRCIIESLTYIPEGEQDSQLLLWLKDLVNKPNNRIPERKFISNMKSAHPSVQWNSTLFFRMLYNLTQPNLYTIACEWLKGDELDEDSLKKLNTKTVIDTEEKAQGIIKNFGIVASSTKPIIICFDQLEAVGSQNPDGTVNLKPLFQINSILKSQNSSNLLIIISVVTNIWQEFKQNKLHQSDLDRIDLNINLEKINLEQVKALWASRLYPLHKKASDQPSSSIYPLTEEDLERKFPNGETQPRTALKIAEKLIRGGEIDSVAAFNIAWLDKYNEIKKQVKKVRYYSSEKLTNMLKLALECKQNEEIGKNIFKGKTKFNAHSVSYYLNQEKIGVIWNEEPNLRTFSALMKAINKLNDRSEFTKLYLIRQEAIGKSNTQGYKLFQKLFNDSQHERIQPTLESVIALATYRDFYTAAKSKELTIGDEFPDVSRLEELTRESGVLDKCELLKKLLNDTPQPPPPELEEYLLNIVKTCLFIGRKALTEKTRSQFENQVTQEEVDRAIKTLINEQQIKIVNPKAKPEEQSICLPT